MTDYEQRCRETCPWCAKDLDRYVGEGIPYHRDSQEIYVGQCTAPTEIQFAEEMAATSKEWQDAYMEAMKRGDQWREKFDSEHETRIKYQDIAYMVCNFLDVALGNSAKRGTCLLAEEDAIHLALVRLFHSQHQPEEPNAKR